MDPETLIALQDSIAHWQRMVDNPLGKKDKPGASQCPLCRKFNPDINQEAQLDCVGCPVQERTGHPSCKETPYHEAATAYNDHLQAAMCLYPSDPDFCLQKFKAAAQAELDFLKSLLP